jgi:hypothetical protein
MAESSEQNNSSSNELQDEFDDLLNEPDEASEATETMVDDEDALDKLLSDNGIDESEDIVDEFAEIDELFDADEPDGKDAKTSEPAAEEELIDEFADDTEEVFSDSSSVADDNVDSVTEQDEFSDDFDITADEDTDEPESEDDLIAETEQAAETTEAISPESEAPASNTHNATDAAALALITSQLTALQNAQEKNSQLIDELSQKDDTRELLQQIDALESAQKSLKQKISKLEGQKPTIAYVGLGVAVLALLVGGGLGIVGFSADSKVEELAENVVSIEEQVEVLVEQEPIKKLEKQIKRLDKMGSDIAYVKSQLTELKEKLALVADTTELDSLKAQISQLNEQNMQMGALLEGLQAQLDALQSRKTKSARKIRKKALAKPQKWQVNLIAYRQEWYARRKAAEFSKQGVPVHVVKIRNNGENWYRLKVDGFKSKNEALAYADKVKKTLNLPSVWVNKQ